MIVNLFFLKKKIYFKINFFKNKFLIIQLHCMLLLDLNQKYSFFEEKRLNFY